MQHRAFSYPSWSRSLWVASLAVALAAAFFVAALTPVTARAQQPGQRPDFKVTQAQFDGRNLHVEYINATGIGYPARRYEVGFQWYNSQGQPVGIRHWLPVPEVERGGVSILDNKYRIELSYRRGGIYGRTLTQFIEERPQNATQLRITVDDGDRIAEEDEKNNVAALTVPLPDLVIRHEALQDNLLTLTYRNDTTSYIRDWFRIAFQWVDKDGMPVGQEVYTNIARMDPTEERKFSSKGETVISGPTYRPVYQSFDAFLRDRATGAETLRITIDSRNDILESSEGNNVVRVLPSRAPPDLVVERITIVDGQPQATIWNQGKGPAQSVVVAHEYRDRAGKRIERGSGSRETAPLGLGPDQKIIAALLGPIPDTAVTIAVTVDPKNAVAETDEQNNAKEGPAPMADLLVVDAKTDNGALALTYRNAGERKADPLSIWLHFANAQGTQIGPLYWMDVSPIRAGGTQVLANETAFAMSSTGQVELTALFAASPAGATHLKVLLDGPDRVVETNEGNNVVLLAKPVVPLPDLTVSDLRIIKGAITWKEKNLGDTVSGNFSYLTTIAWLDTNGKTISERSTQAATATIRAGSVSDEELSTRFGIPAVFLTPPQGAAKLRATVDAKGIVAEKDETNNVVEIVVPLPDLTVSDLTIGKDAITWKEKNLGDTAFGDFTYLTTIAWLDASGTVLGERSIQAATVEIRAGAENTEEMSTKFGIPAAFLIPPAGAAKLRVTIDSKNTVVEKDERNNAVEIVVSLPDLTVSDLRFTKDAITWKEKNLGDTVYGDFTYNTQIAWLDQSGKTLSERSPQTATAEIRKGSESLEEMSTRFGAPASFLTPPPGAVKLRVTIDPKGTVPEKNEGNNVAEVAPPPPPQPDLAFARVTAKWDAPSSKIEYVGANRGTADVERVTLGLQWLDASGRASGPSYTPFEVFGRLRAGATSSTWALPFWDSGETSTRPLGRYLLLPPSDATHLRLTLDPENAVPESDEANNTAVVERPASVPLSDLTITEAKFTTDAFALTYKNIGPVHAGYFIMLSTWFEWVDASGARVGDLVWHDGESLDPKYSVHLDAATVVSSAARGKFSLREFLAVPPDSATHLKVTVDGPNTLLESNEANNVTRLVRPTVSRADLRIADFIMDPITPRAGDRVWFLVRVENVGSAATGTQTATGITVDLAKRGMDRKLIGQFTAADIAPGKAFTHRWTKENYYGWVAVAGTHTIEVCADRAKVVSEGDETNNCARKEVTVAASVDEKSKLPDLTIMDATLDTAALRFWYHNRGESATAPTISLWYEMVDAQGKRVGELRWINLNAAMQAKSKQQGNQLLDFATLDSDRGTMTLGDFVNGALPSATHLRLTIDGSNAHAEANEQNNSVLLLRPGVPKPDAAKPDLVLHDARLADLILRMTIENVGKETAERVMWQFTWLGETGNALATSDLEAAVGTLKPSASYPVELRYANARPIGIFEFLQEMPKEAAALEITVDPNNTIAESDETNNTARVALPGADLAIGASTVRENALIISIVNHGTIASVATDLWLQWYGKGKWLPGSGAVDVPAVGGGATVEVKVPLNRSFGPDGKLLTDIPPTAERLRLFVDGLRKVPERNEQNNDRMVDRAVFPTAAEPVKPGKPDLVPEGLKVGPTSPTEGAMLDFSAIVRNKGTGKAGASVAWFIVDFDRDDEPDVSPEPDDVKPLAPNATQAITWEDAVEAQAGTHAVEFCVDVEEAVDESNEDNNCVSRMFTVGSGPMAIGPFRSILGAILSGLATPIVAGERPY